MPKLEPIPSTSSRGGGRRARGSRVSSSLAEINVVPLVDVMLVLLVIFMVAAPMMQQGFPVQLPRSRRSVATNAPVTVTIPSAFARDRRVQIDGEFVRLAVLAERVRQAMDAKDKKDVMIAGDASVSYGDFISVMDQLRAGGVNNVSMQTQPPTGQ
jgi:biopolymer transport protein TolR